MIPQIEQDILTDFTYREKPSRTFRLNPDTKRIVGYIDKLEAMKQAVYLILNVERYEYLIHSWNYGVELTRLIGKPIAYVLPEIKRVITDALLADSRIKEVDDFVFETYRSKVGVTFTVRTIFGEFQAEKEVEI